MCQPPKDGDQVRAARAEESALASETLERIAHAREVAVGAAAIANSLADSLITEYAQNLAHAAKVAYIVAYITERRAAAAAGKRRRVETLSSMFSALLSSRGSFATRLAALWNKISQKQTARSSWSASAPRISPHRSTHIV